MAIILWAHVQSQAQNEDSAPKVMLEVELHEDSADRGQGATRLHNKTSASMLTDSPEHKVETSPVHI